jgi:hypothetical protein
MMGTTSKRRIKFLVSEPHYFDHLAPIYLTLPEDARGVFTCYSRLSRIFGAALPSSSVSGGTGRCVTLLPGSVRRPNKVVSPR